MFVFALDPPCQGEYNEHHLWGLVSNFLLSFLLQDPAHTLLFPDSINVFRSPTIWNMVGQSSFQHIGTIEKLELHELLSLKTLGKTHSNPRNTLLPSQHFIDEIVINVPLIINTKT